MGFGVPEKEYVFEVAILFYFVKGGFTPGN